MNQPTEYLDTADVLQLLHISKNTLARLHKRGVLRRHRIPGLAKNFYLREELDKLIRSNAIDPETHLYDHTAEWTLIPK